jgi:hypothetical protein
VVALEQRIILLENRLKVLENEISGKDLDLTEVMIKPDQTAGVPVGWGRKKEPDARPPKADPTPHSVDAENWDFHYPPLS